MKRKKASVTLAIVISLSMAGTSLAGEWQWLDHNNDGIAECYYMENGMPLTNTITPDGYQVNEAGAWVVDDVVQTQTITVNNGTTTGGVNHNAGYDPAHPLAGKIDEWNLRLGNTGLIGASGFNICNESFQALLTGQMDKYYMAPAGYSTNPVTGSQVYISQQDYDEGVMIENALYQWFCNWLNGMDFENMSEMDRAREIQKVMAQVRFRTSGERNGSTKWTYYDVLINKEGACSECAMTVGALAKALGLKVSVSGTGNHTVYYIRVNGKAYFGQNNDLDLDWPTPDNVFFQ